MGVARLSFEGVGVSNLQSLTGGGANFDSMGISAVAVQEPEIAQPTQSVSLQKPSVTTPGGP